MLNPLLQTYFPLTLAARFAAARFVLIGVAMVAGSNQMSMECGKLLSEQSRSADAAAAAVADNCRFDERASAIRWQRFKDILSGFAVGTGGITWPDWAEAFALYLGRYCKVASLGVPDAFLEINEDAWLPAVADNQDVVRIELLSRALKANDDLELERLEAVLRRNDFGDEDARRAVETFFDRWNQVRDSRPTFVTFYGQVTDEYASDDWPHALRDRLGLGHYGYPDGAPLPVALMRYSLTEALTARSARKIPVGCALPTVLDDGMHEFFFSVPRENPFGATLHLAPGLAETLTSEILHCRVDYRREHLKKLGWIVRPHDLRGDALREARDLHLLALQLECGREDFGEPMVGRR